MGDETWFSVNGSDRFDDLHPEQPLLVGMKNTQITAYDTQAETFKDVDLSVFHVSILSH